MAREKFLLISLSESKTKELAQAISNETCRKILDYLAEKEATESELAEKLSMPISTVHYNLQQLQKGNLVVVDEFHYSPKGKEVNHYKLANKYIIIAPRSTYGIKEKLKNILPVALLIAVGAGFIQIFTKTFAGSQAKMLAAERVSEAAPLAEKAMATGAEMAQEDAAPTLAQNVAEKAHLISNNIALWFLIGAVIAVGVYLIVEWIRKKE